MNIDAETTGEGAQLPTVVPGGDNEEYTSQVPGDQTEEKKDRVVLTVSWMSYLRRRICHGKDLKDSRYVLLGSSSV